MNRADIIKSLNLEPLVGEGGFFRRTFTATQTNNNRASCNCIYYLETPDSHSKMHVLDIDEMYFYHDGPALEMLLVYEDHSEIVRLGKDVKNGEVPQLTIPKGVYQGSHMSNNDGDYTLVSTMCIPEYTETGFKLGTYQELKDRCLDKLYLLDYLTK